MSKRLKQLVCIVIPLIVLFLPATAFGIEGLSVVEQRVMAIFFMAMLCWILEPIPIFATSVLVIFAELLLVSNKAPYIWRNGSDGEVLERLLSYKAIMGTFASPIIILFLGGFFLAMAATKFRLDQNLARVMLKPFGTNPKVVLLGLMVITAIFSMFMSNTATTAMMLAILLPVLKGLDPSDAGRKAFVLGVPFAANIGGLGTPIGTPPNAVAMKYLVDDMAISFGGWMLFAVPYVIVMLLFVWGLLCFIFPTTTKELHLEIKGSFLTNTQAKIVYVTSAITVVGWLSGAWHGMGSYVVAMIPVAVFCLTGVITAKDLKTMSWDVLWLVSGGIALGMALEKTGLSKNLIAAIPFETFPPLLIIAAACVLTTVMATFMSNTATANLILPIMAALGANLGTLVEFGGAKGLIVAVAFAASLGMALPVSTPPNAMAHASGLIESRDMFKPGTTISIVGLGGLALLLFALKVVGFI